jgi:hypothetical protein
MEEKMKIKKEYNHLLITYHFSLIRKNNSILAFEIWFHILSSLPFHWEWGFYLCNPSTYEILQRILDQDVVSQY